MRMKYIPVSHLKCTRRDHLAIISQNLSNARPVDRRSDIITEKTNLVTSSDPYPGKTTGFSSARRASDESSKANFPKRNENGKFSEILTPDFVFFSHWFGLFLLKWLSFSVFLIHFSVTRRKPEKAKVQFSDSQKPIIVIHAKSHLRPFSIRKTFLPHTWLKNMNFLNNF